jgi:hypothetical protein
MFLKGGVAVSHGRVTGIAGLRRKTKISHVQVLQLFYRTALVLLRITGMQRQRQEDCQKDGSKQQEL